MSKTYISRAGFSAVCFALILSGCATNSYTPPSSLAKDEAKHEVMVNKSFDATWASLIDYASGTFFAIDNFEKASGLITLSFGAADPSHFIDCGQMVAPIFQGSFATFMATEWNATLTSVSMPALSALWTFLVVDNDTALPGLDLPALSSVPDLHVAGNTALVSLNLPALMVVGGVIAVGDLTVENRTDRVELYGSVSLTRDKVGLAAALALKQLIDATVETLTAERLPDVVAEASSKTVKNPFET